MKFKQLNENMNMMTIHRLDTRQVELTKMNHLYFVNVGATVRDGQASVLSDDPWQLYARQVP